MYFVCNSYLFIILIILYFISPSHAKNLLILKFTLKILPLSYFRNFPNTQFLSIVKPTWCIDFSNLFYFGITLYMFWTVLPSVIRPSETCRVLFQNKTDASSWFYCRNTSILGFTALWTSDLLNFFFIAYGSEHEAKRNREIDKKKCD